MGTGSRPLPGVLISLRYIRLFRRILGVVLVPFPGFLYLYKNEQCNANWTAVLVPFPGFLYLYLTKTLGMRQTNCSRPLPGVLISLRMVQNLMKKMKFVLVPFPGFLYLYVEYPNIQGYEVFSSPSRGSYISTVHID